MIVFLLNNPVDVSTVTGNYKHDEVCYVPVFMKSPPCVAFKNDCTKRVWAILLSMSSTWLPLLFTIM